MSYIRKRTLKGLKTGDTFSVSRTFTEEDVVRFADMSRDYNPVHFDERFVKTKNLERRTCHGLLVAGLVTEIGGQIGWLASGIGLKFKKPVYVGDTIRCDFTITDIDAAGRAKAKAVMKNSSGTVVLEAAINGILPGSREKKVMEDMVAEGDPTNKISQ